MLCCAAGYDPEEEAPDAAPEETRLGGLQARGGGARPVQGGRATRQVQEINNHTLISHTGTHRHFHAMSCHARLGLLCFAIIHIHTLAHHTDRQTLHMPYYTVLRNSCKCVCVCN